MSGQHKRVLSIFGAVILVSACASTTVNSVWKDETYTGGKLNKFIVVAVLDNPVNRRIVEAAIVEELKQKGVQGIPANVVLGDKELSKESIVEAVKENQADALMAARLTGVDQETVYNPPTYSVPQPYYYSWGTYYPHMHDYAASPGYTSTYKYYNVETNVYAASTEKLVWSAATETVDPTNINDAAKEFAQKIVRNLQGSGLI